MFEVFNVCYHITKFEVFSLEAWGYEKRINAKRGNEPGTSKISFDDFNFRELGAQVSYDWMVPCKQFLQDPPFKLDQLFRHIPTSLGLRLECGTDPYYTFNNSAPHDDSLRSNSNRNLEDTGYITTPRRGLCGFSYRLKRSSF